MPARTFLGNPCQHGHDGLRYLSNGACVHCTKAKRKATADEAREQAADGGKPKRAYRRKVSLPEVRYAPEVKKAKGVKVRVVAAKAKAKELDPLEDL